MVFFRKFVELERLVRRRVWGEFYIGGGFIGVWLEFSFVCGLVWFD